MGPVASVLLRNPVSDAQVDRLMRTGFRVCAHRDEWVLEDPAALGISGDVSDAGLVGVSVRQDYSAHERLVEAIGFRPVAAIGAWMACNGDADHRLLGHLCLAFALEFDALVEFGGALTPFAWPAHIPNVNPSREQRAEIAQRTSHALRRLPGRLYAVNHGSRSRPRESHVCDAEFLDAWLRHPRFRMIK
ncbi:DUF6368 family protein [Nocardia sp. NPDC052316]|uniref:DUF6368 family protein n=1 Tax=Nocardia sp. NPDC052316 TaxID=3364329 RepID=UPI0037C5F4A7